MDAKKDPFSKEGNPFLCFLEHFSQPLFDFCVWTGFSFLICLALSMDGVHINFLICIAAITFAGIPGIFLGGAVGFAITLILFMLAFLWGIGASIWGAVKKHQDAPPPDLPQGLPT